MSGAFDFAYPSESNFVRPFRIANRTCFVIEHGIAPDGSPRQPCEEGEGSRRERVVENVARRKLTEITPMRSRWRDTGDLASCVRASMGTPVCKRHADVIYGTPRHAACRIPARNREFFMHPARDRVVCVLARSPFQGALFTQWVFACVKGLVGGLIALNQAPRCARSARSRGP